MPSIRGSSRDMQGRSGSRSRESNENVDIEVLRKEYRNMQANRNAFAHESDLVRSVLHNVQPTHTSINPQLFLTQ
jgi:hypothetical protein